MVDLKSIPKHFSTIRKILEKYDDSQAARDFPIRLLEVLEASTQLGHLQGDHTHIYNEFMDLLDDTTAILGEIGDDVSPKDFEELKFHYGNLQTIFAQHCAESKRRI